MVNISFEFFPHQIGVYALCETTAANDLEHLKKENPLLAVEILPHLYILVDGNHRLCLMWTDVSYDCLF